MTKLSDTSLGSIALSVLVANLFSPGLSFFVFYFLDSKDGHTAFHQIEIPEEAA